MLTRKGKQIKSAKDLENKMLEAAKKAKSVSVKIGFPKEKPSEQDGVSAVYKATVNNYGLGVPKRPFMYIAFAQNVEKYRKFLAQSIMREPENVVSTIGKIGAMGAADVKKSIVDLRSPPNSSLTIALKGSSNPLIDTGHMLQSVTWSVS